jgi:hypothetical protein
MRQISSQISSKAANGGGFLFNPLQVFCRLLHNFQILQVFIAALRNYT